MINSAGLPFPFPSFRGLKGCQICFIVINGDVSVLVRIRRVLG